MRINRWVIMTTTSMILALFVFCSNKKVWERSDSFLGHIDDDAERSSLRTQASWMIQLSESGLWEPHQQFGSRQALFY